MIRSDPEGVPVRVNGIPRGTTPVEIPFEDYGVVRLETGEVDRNGDGFPEYAAFSGAFALDAPWYQWFPLDLFSDNLWPGTLHVRREACLVLAPALDPDSDADARAAKARIPGLRIRAEKMRIEEEAAGPEPKR